MVFIEVNKIGNNELTVQETSIIEYKAEDIKNLIYTIRGKQVMLDSDVARLYDTETRIINQAVKRNIERFPEDFGFQLTDNEFLNLRSQIVILNTKVNNGRVIRKYNPYVFTEQGIVMLSGLLRNEKAIKVSINIIEAFVEMRKFIANNANIFNKLINVEYKLLDHDEKFTQVFNQLQNKKENEFKQKIFFEGQIYDAYSLIINIIKSAKTKILIIDNYIDDTILEMLTKKNKEVKVVIITSEKSNILKLDVEKFNEEYPTLEVAKTGKFHDRFIVIDNKKLYHIGASLKDLGKKCFAISKIEDIDYIEKIQNFSKNT